MQLYATMQIGLYRRDDGAIVAELQYNNPLSDAYNEPARGNTGFDKACIKQLQQLSISPVLDTNAYGQLLTTSLFSHPVIKAAFDEANTNAQSQNLYIRLRLYIEPNEAELHGLLWETLREPGTNSAFATDERILFSRYLSKNDWRSIPPQAQNNLRALVIIASPSDISSYTPEAVQLAPLDIKGEQKRAQASLGSIVPTFLMSGSDPTTSPTRRNLQAALHDGYPVIYVICHGDKRNNEPHLWLEDDDGSSKAVPCTGSDFVRILTQLQDERPRLVVLASCESGDMSANAHTSDGGSLSSIGPMLIEAGVPAVIGVQGNVRISTMDAFMPVFFSEVRRDGQLDRAMSVARAAVADQPDSWMPVLFTWLSSGRLWDGTGITDLGKWPALLDRVASGACTPVLGHGMNDMIIGSIREIATSWANEYGFPLAAYERMDLAEVAQFLAVNQGDADFPRHQLGKYMRNAILTRYASDLPSTAQQESLGSLLSDVGALHRQRNPSEPHMVLADPPFSIYVTTSPDHLMFDALASAGKDPQVAFCRWTEDEDVQWPTSVYITEPLYKPDPKRPLVCHFFGTLDEPKSVVLTKDNYFDYLIGVAQNAEAVPSTVWAALARTGLLFLGFHIDDWDFRALFRLIMNQQGGALRKQTLHIAVQLDPEQSQGLDPEGARVYLEEYFQGADVTTYWGSVEDFMKEFQARWAEYRKENGGN